MLDVNFSGPNANVQTNLRNAYNSFAATPTGAQYVERVGKIYDAVNVRYDASLGAASGVESPSAWNNVQSFFGWKVANVTITPQNRMPVFSDSSGNMVLRLHTMQEVLNHEIPHLAGTRDDGSYGLNTVKVQNQIGSEMGVPYQRLTYQGYTANELQNYGYGTPQSFNALPNSEKMGVFNTLLGPINANYSGNNLSADGGFLLYPNKPNTNSLQSVYRK
jgi:hypothetical protein